MATSRFLLVVGWGFLIGCGESTDRGAGRDVPWADWTPERAVGVVNEPANEVFGDVADAVFAGDLGVVVLDGLNRNLRRIDSRGHVREFYGRAGNGPGEFSDPATVAFLAPDTVIVFDRGTSMMHWIHWRTGSAAFIGSTHLPVWPGDACTLDREIYVLGLRDDRIIHQIGRGGEVVRSFGASIPEDGGPGDAPAAWVRSEMGGGSLVCVEDPGVLVHVPELLGSYTVFDRAGEPVAHGRIPEFVGPVPTPSGGGVRLGMDPDVGYAHRVSNAVLLTDRSVLVLIEQRYPRETADRNRRLAAVLDLGNGVVGRMSPGAPAVLAVSPRTVVTAESDPYPRVTFWTRGTASAASFQGGRSP